VVVVVVVVVIAVKTNITTLVCLINMVVVVAAAAAAVHKAVRSVVITFTSTPRVIYDVIIIIIIITIIIILEKFFLGYADRTALCGTRSVLRRRTVGTTVYHLISTSTVAVNFMWYTVVPTVRRRISENVPHKAVRSVVITFTGTPRVIYDVIIIIIICACATCHYPYRRFKF
jgi:hypothetical protein